MIEHNGVGETVEYRSAAGRGRLLSGGWMLGWLLLAACTAHTATAGPILRVMSFNVRVPVESDGADRWEARRELAAEVIRSEQPDLIGSQELVRAQGDYLARRLPEYAWFGTGRGVADGDGDERMGVFYLRDALVLLGSGDFWLSDTPAMPGSISWGNVLPRMVTWGLFERRSDGRHFYLLNSHFPYRDEDAGARLQASRLILRRLAELPADVPVILTGDFNEVPEGRAHHELTRALLDAWTQAPQRDGPGATFHGFTGRAENRIDWVLYRGLKPTRARTLTRNAEGRYPSDHFPVVVDFEWSH